jgi:hypothetical protein
MLFNTVFIISTLKLVDELRSVEKEFEDRYGEKPKPKITEKPENKIKMN